MEQNERTYIVGIGASAGGLEALEAFFGNMPDTDRLAFIVVQHLSPDYKSLMGELLAKHTALRICEVTDGVQVEPGTIYLMPRKTNMTMFNGRLFLTEQEQGLNLPIDIFFRSLAEDQGDRVIGIILSGTGSDGTRGVRAIKEEGGLVMVQDEESSKFNGMPRSALATGVVDYVLPARQLPQELMNFLEGNIRLKRAEDPQNATHSGSLNRIFMLIKRKTGVDLSFYKESTILRRIERRMGINQISDVSRYIAFLEQYPAEITTLFKEMLINVTKFFRDAEAFEALKDRVVPEIMGRKTPGEPIRVWVAGCSTGEEAYSIAIILSEYLEEHDISANIKIFATDIDKDAIEQASYGVYPESIAADAHPARLRKYFIRKGDNYQVSPHIREMVVFAYHNIFKDPPFRQIDLISCRNLLIYLQPILQKKILANFHFSLQKNGFMMLGSSETVGDYTRYFDSYDIKWKIYQCSDEKAPDDAARPSISDMELAVTRERRSAPNDTWSRIRGSERATESRGRGFEAVYERLIEDQLPPCAIINGSREVQHIFGDASPFLKLPFGRMDLDILKMAHADLAIPLGSGLQTMFNEGRAIVFDPLSVSGEDNTMDVQIRLKPLRAILDEQYFAVIFEPVGEKRPLSQGEAKRINIEESVRTRVHELESELQYTKENLQATIEELETSNEELQATNEELLSSNEELQSTNEELQSVNEELITVNSEYQKKIEELSDLNDDIDNILAGTDVGTLLLDSDLRIRKYTPPVTSYFNIIKTDIGRPITDLSHQLDYPDFMEDIRKVARDGSSVDEEIHTESEGWVFVKINPYESTGRLSGGVVITLIDVSSRRRAHEALTRNHELLMRILETNPTAITMLDASGKIIFANSEAEGLFGLTRSDMGSMKYNDEAFHITDEDGNPIPSEQLPFARLMSTKDSVHKYVHCITRPDGGRVTVSITGNPIFGEDGSVEGAVFNVHTVQGTGTA
ncbi:MAG: chemotaxis protein CheB [Spirochaetaceae bacterium]